MPYQYNLASVGELIVVGSYHHLSFYTWSGDLLGHIKRTDLGVSEKVMLSVGRAVENRITVAAGGSGDSVTALYLFNIR